MASNWQDIIWREWYHTEDDEYARHLFDLVAEESVGWRLPLVWVLFFVIGAGFVGLPLSILLLLIGVIVIPAERVLVWITISIFLLAGIVPVAGTIGLILGIPLGRNASWRQWLTWIGPSRNQHYDTRIWRFWSRKRPPMPELEVALYEACANNGKAQKNWMEALYHLEQRRKNPETPDELIAAMKSDNWTERFIARHLLLTVGGEAANKLVALTQAEDTTIEQHQAAIWILQNIGAETSRRLAEQAPDLICSKCLMPCIAHGVRLSALKTFKYYGCAYCHQSNDFLPWPGPIVTVLDSEMTGSTDRQDGVLRVNWLDRRTLIDCNWIEIINATDEDVERFAVQVGNDTDSFRKSRYKKMSCVVGPDCHLSENTWRILRSRFGQVEQADVAESVGRYRALSANSTPNETTSESGTPFASEDAHSYDADFRGTIMSLDESSSMEE